MLVYSTVVPSVLFLLPFALQNNFLGSNCKLVLYIVVINLLCSYIVDVLNILVLYSNQARSCKTLSVFTLSSYIHISHACAKGKQLL